MNKKSQSERERGIGRCKKYPCCLCSFFEYERGTWGYCKLMNASVKGNLKACQLATPFFDEEE